MMGIYLHSTIRVQGASNVRENKLSAPDGKRSLVLEPVASHLLTEIFVEYSAVAAHC